MTLLGHGFLEPRYSSSLFVVRSSFFFSFSVIGVLVLVCNCGICKGRKGGRRCSRIIGKIKALSEGWRLAYIFCVKEFKENVATFEENCTVVVLS
jgi:hypothetical protein